MKDFLVNGSMQKTLAALLIFIVGIGSLAICGYQIIDHEMVSSIAATLAGASVSYAFHQLGYNTAQVTQGITDEKALQLANMIIEKVVESNTTLQAKQP